MSDCSICAAGGSCNYASVASNNVVVEHVFCAKVRGNFWCCPSLRDGKATECARTFGRCDYVNDSSLLAALAAVLPLLFICCLISAFFSWRRSRNQAVVVAMPPQPGYPAYPGQPPYGQPVYGQPVNNNNGPSAGGAFAAGAAGGLIGGMLLGGAMDGGGGGGGDFSGDVGI